MIDGTRYIITSKNSKYQKIQDISGERFGRLTVVNFAGYNDCGYPTWNTICDCGNNKVVVGKEIRRGNVKSCGCLLKEITSIRCKMDISGMRFTRLTAISRIENDPDGRWVCRCDCGKSRNVRISKLLSGETKSCGCYARDMSTTHGMSNTPEYIRYKANKRHEAKKSLDTRWTPEMELELTRMFPNCVVCGGTDRLATDHVYPLSKGNGLRPGNATKLCIHCNASKKNKNPYILDSNTRDRILSSAEFFERYWNDLCLI